jgi:anti-sigma regulatory factor (Ser/Thr protein kinase)
MSEINFYWLHDRDSLIFHIQPRSDDGKHLFRLYIFQPDLSTEVANRQLGGLGIYLIKQMAAGIKYEYREGCNIIMLWFEK